MGKFSTLDLEKRSLPILNGEEAIKNGMISFLSDVLSIPCEELATFSLNYLYDLYNCIWEKERDCFIARAQKNLDFDDREEGFNEISSYKNRQLKKEIINFLCRIGNYDKKVLQKMSMYQLEIIYQKLKSDANLDVSYDETFPNRTLTRKSLIED